MSNWLRNGGVCAVLCAVAASGCAGIQRVDLGGTTTMTLAELRSSPGQFESAFNKGQPVVISLRAGDELPVKLALESPVITLRAGDNALRVERDVYLYIAQRKVLVSPDRERWIEPWNKRGRRELFGLRGGTFQMGFGVSPQNGPVVTIAVASSGSQSEPGQTPPPTSNSTEPEGQASPPAAPPEQPTAAPEQPEAGAPAPQ